VQILFKHLLEIKLKVFNPLILIKVHFPLDKIKLFLELKDRKEEKGEEVRTKEE